MERLREQKVKSLKPEERSRIEDIMYRFKEEKILERFSAGFNGLRAKTGNMVVGGGFAIGPEYFREDLFHGALHFRTAAQGSTKNYYKLDQQWMFPKLLRGKAYAESYTVHHNYSGIDYYGPGPDSSKTGRSNYRLEDTSTEGTAALLPWKSLKLGGTIGYLWANTGPGKEQRFISAEQIYSPAVSPGIDIQSNFFRYGAFIQHDTRDNPRGPKEGHNYLLQYTWFDDRKRDAFSFRRLDAEIQQFIPLFNRTRVFGIRAKTVLTGTDALQSVPFYLQPMLGGSEDLRGFRPFRFRDRNMFVLNGEYRWDVFSGLDGAIFVDAGKVFPRRGQLNFTNLESSVGFGLRFNARNSTFMRIDVGFSHEGFQLWVKFSDVFVQRKFGAALVQPVF